LINTVPIGMEVRTQEDGTSCDQLSDV